MPTRRNARGERHEALSVPPRTLTLVTGCVRMEGRPLVDRTPSACVVVCSAYSVTALYRVMGSHIERARVWKRACEDAHHAARRALKIWVYKLVLEAGTRQCRERSRPSRLHTISRRRTPRDQEKQFGGPGCRYACECCAAKISEGQKRSEVGHMGFRGLGLVAGVPFHRGTHALGDR